jgi:hypothetical protein
VRTHSRGRLNGKLCCINGGQALTGGAVSPASAVIAARTVKTASAPVKHQLYFTSLHRIPQAPGSKKIQNLQTS